MPPKVLLTIVVIISGFLSLCALASEPSTTSMTSPNTAMSMRESTLQRWKVCASNSGMILPPDFTTKTLSAGSATFVKAWRAQSSMQIIEYSATELPTAALIFTHGLGDTGMGWGRGFQDISAQLPHVLFVFPTARSIPVTINQGMKMSAWFDVRGSGPSGSRDSTPEGFDCSVCFMEALTAQVASKLSGAPTLSENDDAEFIKIDSLKSRIAIGGFSQGGALSAFVGHTTPEGSHSTTSYAGIASLSGFLTARAAFLETKRDFTKKVPLFIAHGDKDTMISSALSKDSFDFISTHHRGSEGAATLQHKVYPGMAHSSSEKEMADLTAFLKKVLPKL